MANEITAKIGTKLSEAEDKALDPREIGRVHAQPPKADVQAQWDEANLTICPYCGCAGRGHLSPYVYRYFTCHCCGRTYRA
jgi:hypothetical protein